MLFILYENATGYGLFRTTEFEEVGIFVKQVQETIADISRFRSIIFLHAFHQFENANKALENMECIMTGKLHLDLQIFLENNVPKERKEKQAIVLGVSNCVLATSINDTLGISCNTTGVILEIIRGIRLHFPKFIKGYKDKTWIHRSQLRLSHQYARIQLNIKSDELVLQPFDLRARLDKSIKTLGSRVRQWYLLHFPELTSLVPDIQTYVKCVNVIKDRKLMDTKVPDRLLAIIGDAEKVERILKAAQTSMGTDIAASDLENIQMFIKQIVILQKKKEGISYYLNTKMRHIAPNLSAFVGEEVGAELISKAGSLTKLAKMPSSTVQILGAKKSLFRTLKLKHQKENFNTLKKNTLIGKYFKAGRTSRYFANKCALAAGVDCFSATSTNVFGEQLKQKAKLHLMRNFGLDPSLVGNKGFQAV